MRIGSGGSGNVNVLQSDTGQFRNEDFVTAAGLSFGVVAVLSGVAAEYSQIQLFNKVGSGIVVIIDEIYFSVDTSTDVFYGFDTGDVGADLRSGYALYGAKTESTAKLRADTNESLAANKVWRTSVLAETHIPLKMKYPVMLGESMGFNIEVQTVNIGLTGGYIWREV